MKVVSLFTGAGGLDLGLHQVSFVEPNFNDLGGDQLLSSPLSAV
jgi:site-specific DNA-cytosine methylase